MGDFGKAEEEKKFSVSGIKVNHVGAQNYTRTTEQLSAIAILRSAQPDPFSRSRRVTTTEEESPAPLESLWKTVCNQGKKEHAQIYLSAFDGLYEKDNLKTMQAFAEHYVGSEDAFILMRNAAMSFALDAEHPALVRDRFKDIQNGDKSQDSQPTESFKDAFLKRLFEMGRLELTKRTTKAWSAEQSPAARR
jgi:hypothetical protein